MGLESELPTEPLRKISADTKMMMLRHISGHWKVMEALPDPLLTSIWKLVDQTMEMVVKIVRQIEVGFRQMKPKVNPIVFGAGFLYFVLHLSVLMGYATGQIPHTPFNPFEAIKLMFGCSVTFAVIAPLVWVLAGRKKFSGLSVVVLCVAFVVTALLDVWFYRLASAAV